MDVYTFIILLHIIGTVLGTGAATLAEVHITKALKDGHVSPDEGRLLHSTYFTIRVGMAFLLVSILGMILYYISNDMVDRLFQTKVLFKEFLFVMIVINAVCISRRFVPLWLGAATSFTSWWLATILGVAGYIPLNFIQFLVGYIILVLTVAGALHFIKKIVK